MAGNGVIDLLSTFCSVDRPPPRLYLWFMKQASPMRKICRLGSSVRSGAWRLVLSGVVWALCSGSAMAISLYWDTDGATPGSGSTPNGDWGTDVFWNTDATGEAGTFQAGTTFADNLFFVAGTNSTTAYAVTLDGDQAANLLTFQSNGAITLGDNSTTINLSGGISAVNTSTAGSGRGVVTIDSNIALQANQSFSNANSTNALIVGGVISGAFSLNLTSNGSKVFRGTNTYTGGTTISNASNLTLTGAGSLGSGGVNLNGTFSTLTFNHATEVTFNNTITGAGTSSGVTKTGANTLNMTGANTYTGGTLIRNGILNVSTVSGAASNLGGPNAILKLGTSSETGTLRYIGTGETTGRSLQFAGTSGGAIIQNDGTGALIFSGTISAPGAGDKTFRLQGNNTGDNEIQGVILNNSVSNTTSVTKNGSGKWILSGANTYTGSTLVSAGTLLINGSLHAGSSVNVSNGATLGGSGTIGGLVTTAGTTSVIAPGNSPGTLMLSGGLNASAGANFVFELGTSSDLLTLNSGVFTGSSAANGLVFDFSNSGGLTANTTYTLVTFGTGSSTGLDYTDLLGNTMPSGFVLNNSFGGGENGFQINGDSLQVQFAAIPEPSSYAMPGMGVLWVLRRKLRRVDLSLDQQVENLPTQFFGIPNKL